MRNMAHAQCMLVNQGYKYTHSGWVTLIASPLQQWLDESSWMLRYTYVACLVVFYFFATLNLSRIFFRSSHYGSRIWDCWRRIPPSPKLSTTFFSVIPAFRDYCKCTHCASESVSNMHGNALCETQQMRHASHSNAMMMMHQSADTLPKRACILWARYTD